MPRITPREREGIIKAARQLSGVDTGGLVPGPLDYTKLGDPSTRSVYIARPASVTGDLKPIGGVLERENAKNYDVAASA